jgi:threonine synthase
MLLYSTNNHRVRATLKEAVMKGLPEDNGLYMPVQIPVLPDNYFKTLQYRSFQEIACMVTQTLFQGAISDKDIEAIVLNALNFPAPLIRLDEETYILELFHGPSLAFKDFGARFMSQLMGYFNRGEDSELTILVATSGDTGGAVASGFFRTPGIRVIILYPSGKVSFLQEQQLTTLGHNIHAVEVAGNFDDCQAMVKQAFLDPELNTRLRLSAANSINIARLVPQSFYYFEAFKQLAPEGPPVVFCVPSGNFGNLTAGLIAKKMGLPVYQFIAATNANDIVPKYLQTGTFKPLPSVPTLSNAMDVGNPSNFARMDDLYAHATGNQQCSTWNNMREDILGFSASDIQTETILKNVFQQYHYIIDPHGAVGIHALEQYKQKQNTQTRGIVLETAHPAKFLSDVQRILGFKIPIPERLAGLDGLPKTSTKLPADFSMLKDYMLNLR